MSEQIENLMEKIVSLAKRRGFVYPGSEIYGGLANTWDYGPLGVELKNNIKQAWWKHFVNQREDMVGIDASILMNPKVWVASGHVAGFSDPMIDCKKCKQRFRVDHLIEDSLNLKVEGLSPEDLNKIIKENDLACPSCKSKDWTEARKFNLLFETSIGNISGEKSVVYLRGETAQAMFVDFKNVLSSSRKKIPFGIAQQGKAFRNEITPGNFIFRTLEFEQMEIEYFIREKDWIRTFNMWQEEMQKWLDDILQIKKENIRIREHTKEELSFYSKKTIDFEYNFPFGGFKELYGMAYRTDYDLTNHQKESGEDMSYFDQEANERFIPHVIEPTFGVDRTFLALIIDCYNEEKAPTAEGEEDTRVVLKFPKNLAPIKIAILPLSKKEELSKVSKEIYDKLKTKYTCEYDETQSIGKRYRRQDEIGTPYCITIDFDTLEDKAVTIRDRDTMKQERIEINGLEKYFAENF